LGLGVPEGLGDVGVDEHHDEVVEGVHRPAQHGGQKRVALIDGQALFHPTIVPYGVEVTPASSPASTASTGEQPLSILTAACASPRVGPRLTIATGIPRAAAYRTNR